MTKENPFASDLLESISRTLGDFLTGSQITKLLIDSQIKDTDSLNTKWKRIYNAFANSQNQHQCSNQILIFISQSLQPVLFMGKEGMFQDFRNEINLRLSFAGFEVSERGKFIKTIKSTTIAEAEERANKFKSRLQDRNVHEHIFMYCGAELLVENYFHSVFEATKSIAERIREMTGLNSDGISLIDTAFSTSIPLIKINRLINDTDRSEHLGFANLIKGLLGIIRNPTAHVPKIKFIIGEQEALDIMTTISYIHRRLDKVATNYVK